MRANSRWARAATVFPFVDKRTIKERRSLGSDSREMYWRSASRSRMLVSVERRCASARCNSAMLVSPEAARCERMCPSPWVIPRLSRKMPIRCVARIIRSPLVSSKGIHLRSCVCFQLAGHPGDFQPRLTPLRTSATPGNPLRRWAGATVVPASLAW